MDFSQKSRKNTFLVLFCIIISIKSFQYHSIISHKLRNVKSQLKLAIKNELPLVEVDVAVIGGGIAGTTISYLLQEQKKLKVAVIDPLINGRGTWYPNYGECRDEWHHLSDQLKLPELKECTTTEWVR